MRSPSMTFSAGSHLAANDDEALITSGTTSSRRITLPVCASSAAQRAGSLFYRLSTELGRKGRDPTALDNTSETTFPQVNSHFPEPDSTRQNGRSRFGSPHLHNVMSPDIPDDRTHVYGFGCLFFRGP
jgi:hypothetical protein